MPKPLESFTTGIQQNSSCLQNPLDKLNSLVDASRCQKKTIRVNNLGIKIVNQKNDHPTINGISKLKKKMRFRIYSSIYCQHENR